MLLSSTRGPAVAFDGERLAAIDDVAVPSVLHYYDAEGGSLGQVAVPGASGVIATDCGFGVPAAGASSHSVLRCFAPDLSELGGGGELEWGPLQMWDGERFASFAAYPLGSFPNELRFLSRSGGSITTISAEWSLTALSAIWDGSEYVVVGIGGMTMLSLTGLNRDGHRTWSRSVDLPREGMNVGLAPTAAGFFVYGGYTHLSISAHLGATGDPVGSVFDLGTALGITGLDPIALASHDDDVLLAYVVTESDMTRSVRAVHLDSVGHPIGAPRELIHGSTLPLRELTLLWAGYSYLVAYGGDAPGPDQRVFALRVCP